MNDTTGRKIMVDVHRIAEALEKLCEILERDDRFKKPKTIFDYRTDQ